MKTIVKYTTLTLCCALAIAGCKKSEPAASEAGKYIEFYNTYDSKEITTKTSTFYYLDANKTTDTVWFRMKTVGGIPIKSSAIKFMAFKDPSTAPLYPDAVAGVHYVPFDDPSIAKLMKIEAGQYEVNIPVVLKRDPSLKTATYQLKFKIVPSDDLSPSSTYHNEASITISDALSQPSNWYATGFFLGNYQTVKHAFMIDHSGERWDAAFITTVTADANLSTYYKYKFIKELKELNEQRAAQGLPPLRQNPADPTTVVSFPAL